GDEVEVSPLHIDEEARLQIALVLQPRSNAAVHRSPPRVVQFADLAVAAALRKISGAGKALNAVRRREFELSREVLVFDVGVVIDGTALQRLHDRKSVRVHEAALDGGRHLVPLIAAEEV